MSRIADFPNLAPNETAWEWSDTQVCIQWPCTECDGGLLCGPARFCGACGGTGYGTRLISKPMDRRSDDLD